MPVRSIDQSSPCFVVQSCIRPAKTLSYMINSRHVAVISDVELSVLKVSLLERVQFHEPPVAGGGPKSSLSTRERKGAASASSSVGLAAVVHCKPRLGISVTVALSAVSLVALQSTRRFSTPASLAAV